MALATDDVAGLPVALDERPAQPVSRIKDAGWSAAIAAAVLRRAALRPTPVP